MPSIVTYTKNLVSGPKKGTKYVEKTEISSPASWKKAMQLKLQLMQITDLFPQKDPVTGALCYVTDIKVESTADEEQLQSA